MTMPRLAGGSFQEFLHSVGHGPLDDAESRTLRPEDGNHLNCLCRYQCATIWQLLDHWWRDHGRLPHAEVLR